MSARTCCIAFVAGLLATASAQAEKLTVTEYERISTKIYLCTNAQRLRIETVLTPGETHDVKGYDTLMPEDAPDPTILHADHKRCFQATSCSAGCDANVHGMRSSIFELGWPLTIFASVSTM